MFLSQHAEENSAHRQQTRHTVEEMALPAATMDERDREEKESGGIVQINNVSWASRPATKLYESITKLWRPET
jgi:hypothetical protein